jgi:hypothetical protein
MAVYRINPGDLTTGVGVPTGFTARWGASNVTVSVINDAASPTGKAIELAPATSSSRRFFSIDAVNSDGDRGTCDIIGLVRITALGTAEASFGGFGSRCTGSAGNEGGTMGPMGLTPASTEDMRLITYVSGSATPATTKSGDLNWAANTLYWLRQATGSSTTLYLYPFNDPLGTEIGDHTKTSTDSNSDNWIGLFSFAVSASAKIQFLYVGIGTGADSAPLPLDPVLTTPTGTATGSTTANLSVSAPYVSGTVYRVVTTSATAPTKDQVQDGEDHTGAAAVVAASTAIATAGTQNYSASGLTEETTYYAHYMWINAIGGRSAVVSSASFETESTGTLVLRNILPFYDDESETTLTDDTDVTIVVLTEASPPVVVGEYTEDIVAGYASITDTPFDTENDGFTMQFRKGTFSRVVNGEVVPE